MIRTTVKQLSGVSKYLVIGLAALSFSAWSAQADQKMKKMMDHSNMDHSKMMKASDMKKSPMSKADDLSISGVWARMSFGKAVNSAGFMVIKNTGKNDDKLVGASSKISKITELHTHIRDGEIMRMRRVEGGIAVPKGGEAKLQPGGFHIMFIGLHKALKNGDSFPLTLKFEQAGEVTIDVTARKMAPKGSMPKGMMMDHSKMDHSKMMMDHKK